MRPGRTHGAKGQILIKSQVYAPSWASCGWRTHWFVFLFFFVREYFHRCIHSSCATWVYYRYFSHRRHSFLQQSYQDNHYRPAYRAYSISSQRLLLTQEVRKRVQRLAWPSPEIMLSHNSQRRPCCEQQACLPSRPPSCMDLRSLADRTTPPAVSYTHLTLPTKRIV